MNSNKISEEVNAALAVLSNESKKDNCHKNIKRLFTVKYPSKIQAKNDHDSLTKLIFLQDYISKLDKEDKPLSQTQARVLAYYAMRGNCDKESRIDLALMLKKDVKDVHLYNHTLVNMNYLEKTGYKSGTFVFSKKFQAIQDYWKKCRETENPLTFLVEIENEY